MVSFVRNSCQEHGKTGYCSSAFFGLCHEIQSASPLQLADEGIGRHRKGDAITTLRWCNGRAVGGITVDVRPLQHESRFGNVFRLRALHERGLKELFNFISLLEFNWGQHEPEQGRPQLTSQTEFIKGWCRQHQLRGSTGTCWSGLLNEKISRVRSSQSGLWA